MNRSLSEAAVSGSAHDGTEPEFMTTAEVAARLRTPADTIRYWRSVGKGPASFKVGGRRVLYAREDVEAFIAEARGVGAR